MFLFFEKKRAIAKLQPRQPAKDSTLRDFPMTDLTRLRNCQSARGFNTACQASARVSTLLALVANRLGRAPKLQLCLPKLQHCKTLQSCNLPKFQKCNTLQFTAQARLPNYRPGKVAKLPICKVSNTAGLAQHCKAFQATAQTSWTLPGACAQARGRQLSKPRACVKKRQKLGKAGSLFETNPGSKWNTARTRSRPLLARVVLSGGRTFRVYLSLGRHVGSATQVHSSGCAHHLASVCAALRPFYLAGVRAALRGRACAGGGGCFACGRSRKCSIFL